MDRSNGYEEFAAVFLAGRGRGDPGIGVAVVRRWARTLPRGATVLDLGCGPGVPISRVLIEEGLAVYGVDASPTFAATFHKRFPNVPVACETVEDSPFFNRSFEGVLAWGLVFLLHKTRTNTRKMSISQVSAPSQRPPGRPPDGCQQVSDVVTTRATCGVTG
jgi:hypothetical protein